MTGKIAQTRKFKRTLPIVLMKIENDLCLNGLYVVMYLHKNGFVRRVSKKKLVIREVNRKNALPGAVRRENLTTTGERNFLG